MVTPLMDTCIDNNEHARNCFEKWTNKCKNASNTTLPMSMPTQNYHPTNHVRYAAPSRGRTNVTKTKKKATKKNDTYLPNCLAAATTTKPTRLPHSAHSTATTARAGIPRVTTVATRLVPATASPLSESVSVSTPPRATPTRTNSVTNSPWNTSLIGTTSTSCPWTKTDGSLAADTRPLITRGKCRTLSVCLW